jgi:Fe-S-cluster-containing dehydrogenase component
VQLGFYFDQTRCTGCNTCADACKDFNDIPAGPAPADESQLLKKDHPGSFGLFKHLMSSLC